jgi:hypothetical protein
MIGRIGKRFEFGLVASDETAHDALGHVYDRAAAIFTGHATNSCGVSPGETAHAVAHSGVYIGQDALSALQDVKATRQKPDMKPNVPMHPQFW